MRYLLSVVVLVVWAGVLNAATIHVPADQPTIQAGIDAAVNWDTVLVAPGTYVEDILFDGEDVAVISSDGPAVTTIQPPVSIQFISGEGPGCQLTGFTILNAIVISGSGPEISECVFRDISAVAIQCSGSYPTIKHNLFYNNGSISCIGISSGPARIINNTFDSNNRGFYNNGGEGVAKNNIITNSSGYGIHGSFDTLDFNDVWNNNPDYINGPGAGPYDISGNPQYTDAATYDYTLQPTSPCIDAGDPDLQYNDPDGTRNDMGAFPNLAGSLPAPTNINFGTEDNLHVVNHTPTMYWKYYDTTGLSQTAYELEVGTDEDWSVAEMWNTGEVMSSDTFTVYGGAVLEDGITYYLRIRVSNEVTWGGWREVSFHMNAAPSVPTQISPIGQALAPVAGVRLIVGNATDSENDNLVYDFEVYEDPTLTVLIASEYGVTEQPTITASIRMTGFMMSTEYWWHTRVSDAFESSDWSSAESFIARGPATIHVPADEPTIQVGIYAASDGDTVLVAPGTYVEDILFDGEDILVVSSDGPAVTTIQPPVSIQFISGEGPGCQLNGFTILNGIAINGSGPVISGCVFRDIGVVAIQCSGYPIIEHNLFYNNGSISCIGINGGTARIINNTFDSNNRGFYSNSGQGVAKNNIITNSSGYGIHGSFDTLDFNDVWNNNPDYINGPGAGPYDISGNPQYTDAATYDYTLQPTSPCIDAGDPDLQYNDPDGTRNDMGAFPFSALPPYITPIDPSLVSEGDTICFTVSATDPDSTIPVLTAVDLPPGANFVDSGNGNGLFCWTPSYEQAGVYTVTFIASDGFLSDSETVQITVNNVNRPPVVTPPSDTVVNEGILLELLVTASDPDSTLPSLAVDDLPGGASFVDSGNGVGLLIWMPTYDQAGIHPVTFVASDGTLADSAVVQITVNNVNRPPVVTQPVDTVIDEGTLLGLIVSATDPDGTIPSLIADSLPPGATFVDSSNGSGLLTWTPDFTQAGIYNVLFIAVDDSSVADTGVIVITVNHVNLPPVLDSIGPRELYEGQHLEIVVTASDFDEDELSLIAEGLPANANFIDSGNGHGLLQFDPQPDQSGLYPILFVVSDGSLDDSELVEITVFDGEPIINTLTVGGEVAPEHLIIHTPLVEWSYTDPLEQKAQTQVEVAVGTDDDWQYAEMWNPAPFQTPDTFVTYAGSELVDGETYYLRLRVHNGVAWSEWFGTSFRMNSLPSVPVPLSPISDEETGILPMITVQVSSDGEGDILTYDFEAFSDSSCGDLGFYDTTGVSEGDAVAAWPVDTLQENCRHWWKARSFDGYEYSDWTELQSFYVNGTPEPPTAPQAQYPPDTSGLPVFDMLPTFTWSESTDADPLDTVRYKLEVSINPEFSFLQTVDSILNPWFTLTDSLWFSTQYWWRVMAFDNTGLSTMSPNTPDLWTWTLGDIDHSHTVDISDLVMLVDFMFNGGPAPYPPFVADIDGSCSVDISDLVYLVDFMFTGGPAPLVGCE